MSKSKNENVFKLWSKKYDVLKNCILRMQVQEELGLMVNYNVLDMYLKSKVTICKIDMSQVHE